MKFILKIWASANLAAGRQSGATVLCGSAHMCMAYKFQIINCFTPTAVRADEMIGDLAVFNAVKVIIVECG